MQLLTAQVVDATFKKNLVWFKIRLGGFLSKKREESEKPPIMEENLQKPPKMEENES